MPLAKTQCSIQLLFYNIGVREFDMVQRLSNLFIQSVGVFYFEMPTDHRILSELHFVHSNLFFIETETRKVYFPKYLASYVSSIWIFYGLFIIFWSFNLLEFTFTLDPDRLLMKFKPESKH